MGREAGHHFIEQQDARLGRQRTRDLEPLALGQGQRRGGLAAFARKAENFEHLLGVAARLAHAAARIQRADHHVVEHGHSGERLHQLKRAADAGAANLVGPAAVDTLSSELDDARIRLEHAGDQVEAGGLAGAVGPNQRDDAALGNGEAHILSGAQTAEALRQTFDFQERGHVTRLACRRDRDRGREPWQSGGQMPLGSSTTTRSRQIP